MLTYRLVIQVTLRELIREEELVIISLREESGYYPAKLLLISREELNPSKFSLLGRDRCQRKRIFKPMFQNSLKISHLAPSDVFEC